MKKMLFLSLLIPVIAFSQKGGSLGIGLKFGPNFSDVSNASSFGGSNRVGFNAGIFLDIGKKLIGSRTEILYSQQGFNYSNDSTKGSETHNYIALAQLIVVNITKYVQVQAGFQTGYLLNVKVDNSQTTGIASVDNVLKYYNRFDYGFTGGIEIHPYLGILVGARYNLSFSNLYNQDYQNLTSGNSSSPTVDFKNNVVQVFVGYKF
jgi:Outer membrane protein beta-barrel domain